DCNARRSGVAWSSPQLVILLKGLTGFSGSAIQLAALVSHGADTRGPQVLLCLLLLSLRFQRAMIHALIVTVLAQDMILRICDGLSSPDHGVPYLHARASSAVLAASALGGVVGVVPPERLLRFAFDAVRHAIR